jgi:hypothetical protein
LEVEVGCVRVAGVAQQADYLPLLDVFAHVNSQAVRLHVGVEGEPPVSDLDHEIVAIEL